MVVSRRVWAGVVAALPAVLVSLRFFDVLLHPASGSNGEWAEDANFLVKLEFLLIFVTTLTAWIAGQATALNRVAAMSALAVVFGAIGYGLWIASDGSVVILGVGSLIAGRFLAGVIAGPDASVEYIERTVVGLVFYFAILFVAFELPEMLPRRYEFHLPRPAAAFCALYFLLLALVEATQIYIGTPEAASSRPTVRLGESGALMQSSLMLRFAGDAFEVVEFARWRTAGRIVGFFMGMVPTGIGAAIFIAGRTSRRERLDPDILPEFFALFMLALGALIIYQSLRQRDSTSILQVRPGGLAKLELSNGKLGKRVELGAAEIKFDVMRPGTMLGVSRKGDEDRWLMLISSGSRDEAAVRSLQHLFELYMSGDPSPQGLRKALQEDPGLAALLGLEVVKRLLSAPPMQVREGTIACPGCKNEIAASAPHCGYCGMLYPAQD